MSTPEQVAAQAAALAKVRVARIEREKADKQAKEALERLNTEIRAAKATGADTMDIALAAGLSRQRIDQIIRDQ